MRSARDGAQNCLIPQAHLTLKFCHAYRRKHRNAIEQWGHEYPQINLDFCCLLALQAPPNFVVLALGSLCTGCRLIRL